MRPDKSNAPRPAASYPFDDNQVRLSCNNAQYKLSQGDVVLKKATHEIIVHRPKTAQSLQILLAFLLCCIQNNHLLSPIGRAEIFCVHTTTNVSAFQEVYREPCQNRCWFLSRSVMWLLLRFRAHANQPAFSVSRCLCWGYKTCWGGTATSDAPCLSSIAVAGHVCSSPPQYRFAPEKPEYEMTP